MWQKQTPWKEQCGTEFYEKYSSQAEPLSPLLIMESEDLIPLHASPLLHILKTFVLPTKIEKAKIMVQDFIRCLLGQYFFFFMHTIYGFSHLQTLAIVNSWK